MRALWHASMMDDVRYGIHGQFHKSAKQPPYRVQGALRTSAKVLIVMTQKASCMKP